MFRMSLVAAVMFIIIGGLIIFFDGRGGCIVCNGLILTAGGLVSIGFGLLGIFSNLGSKSVNISN